MSHARRNIILI